MIGYVKTALFALILLLFGGSSLLWASLRVNNLVNDVVFVGSSIVTGGICGVCIVLVLHLKDLTKGGTYV